MCLKEIGLDLQNVSIALHLKYNLTYYMGLRNDVIFVVYLFFVRRKGRIGCLDDIGY